MGASNAIRAYATYGSTMPDHALRVLVYMALVARDGDAEPWFGLGHEALSELALGRKVPSEDDDPKGRAAALRAVRRAMTELQNAGAIRTSSRARYGAHHNQGARYRLYLEAPCSEDTARPVPPDAQRPMGADASSPVNSKAIGRFAADHRTPRVHPQDAERPPKEEEEEEERMNKGSVVDANVEGTTAGVRNEDHFQGSLLVGVTGGAAPDTPWPGRRNRWRDPEAKALEQLADSRSRRAAAERSAAS